MRKFKITVNGNEYEVLVEELDEESDNKQKEDKNDDDKGKKRK